MLGISPSLFLSAFLLIHLFYSKPSADEQANRWKLKYWKVSPIKIYQTAVLVNWAVNGICLSLVELQVDVDDVLNEYAVGYFVSQFVIWAIIVGKKNPVWNMGFAAVPGMALEVYFIVEASVVYMSLVSIAVAAKLVLVCLPLGVKKSRVVSMEIPLNDFKEDVERKCSFSLASVWGKAVFTWVNDIMDLSSEVPKLHAEDIDPLPEKDRVNHVFERFNNELVKRELQKRSLLMALFGAFGRKYMLMGVLKFFADFLNFSGPLVLSLLVKFLSSGNNENMYLGYVWVSLLFCSVLFSSLLQSQYDFYTGRISLWVHFMVF